MITEIFLMSLAAVESGNDPNAVGDGGLAVGPLQLHEVYVADVERVLECPTLFHTVPHPGGECPERPCLDDRHSLEASLFIAGTYLEFWSSYLKERHGWEMSYVDLCALHRYGPSWRPGYAKKTLRDRIRSRKLKALMLDLELKAKKQQ